MDSSENIRVYVRVRPLSREKDAERAAWRISQDKTSIAHVDTDKEPYVLDNVFDHNDSTKKVYDVTTKKLIRLAVDGFNSTVFAYGQTSSGKTHTMRGTDSDPGIIPLAIKEMFDIISGEQRDFTVRVSYMEIYNEDIRDLLVSGDQRLAIKQSTDGTVVSGLKEETVTTLEEVMALVELGDAQRHVGETKMNARSSRSHAIFRMAVESTSSASSGMRMSTLNLVDLAGSERISKTGAEGQRKKEGAAINKSLLTLGTVISKLSEGASHVPYRDSKLTRILQSSLGGNAKTAMICAITPSSEHVDESHCSLAFACRAKTIVNNASVNEVLSDSALLRKQAKEIEALKSQLNLGQGGKMDEDAVRRKIQSITTMLLNKHQSDEGPSHLLKKDRRKTWCPDVYTQKRHAEASDSTDPCHNTSKKIRRISDGHLMLKAQVERMVSMQHPDGTIELAGSHEETEESLQKQVASLQHANQLLQKQLDAMMNMVQKKREELRVAENDLRKVAQEKGNVLPALKEAQWKNRQLEKDIAHHKEKLDQALEKINTKDMEYSTALREKEAMLKEAEECAQNAISQIEALQSTVETGTGSSKELIDAKAELDTLQLKYKRAVESKESLANELNSKIEEVEHLQAKLANTTKAEDKSHRQEQDMLDEIERLQAHIKDLEKRKRAPLYQKKQDAELEAAKARAAEAESRAEKFEEQANEDRVRVKDMEKDIEKMRNEYEAKIIDLRDESLAMSKKLEAALQAASGHHAQSSLRTEKEAAVEQIAQLQKCIEDKDQAIESVEAELSNARLECTQLRSQLEEVQACADAASAHVRFLEDKAEQEDQEVKDSIQEIENNYQGKVRSLEKSVREQEDLCEKFRLEVHAMGAENTSLKEQIDSLTKRVELASSTLNAVDELRDLKKKHKEEVAKLNAQLRQATVGSKGNERAAERANKDTNRLKSQIQDLETKLKKVVAEKSALQSEKAALDREHRTAKASLEKLNKNANRAAAVEERKRQPLLKDLEDTKMRLASVEEELYECKASLEKSEEKALALEQTLDSEKANICDLESMLEEHRQELEDINTRYDDLDCLHREKQVQIEVANTKIESIEGDLKEANKNVAKLNEQIRGLKHGLEKSGQEKQDIQDRLDSIQQDKKSLENALAEAETKVDMMDALQLDLDSEKAHVITLQQNFQIMEKGLEDHKKELDSYKEKSKSLDGELAIVQQTLGEKDEYISSLENQINDLMAKSMEMEASLDASKCEVKKTKSLLSQAENAIEEHETTITQIHAERVGVEKELKITQERCSQLEQEGQKLKEEYELKLKSLSETSDLHKSSVEELQKSFENEKSNLSQQVQNLQAQVQTLQSSLGDLESAQSQKQSEFDAERQNLVSSLDVAKKEHSNALEKLQYELQESKQATANVSACLQEQQSLVRDLRKSIVEMQEQTNVLKDENTSAHEAKACLEAEIARVKEEMRLLECSHKDCADTMPPQGEILKERYDALEKELRRSKRREEKLQALQYRLQQDVKKSGGSLEAFKTLRDVRSLEYELDRTANRAEKEIRALKAALAAKSTSYSNSNGISKEMPSRNPLSEKNV